MLGGKMKTFEPCPDCDTIMVADKPELVPSKLDDDEYIIVQESNCPNCNKKIIDSYSLHHIAARVEKNGVLEDIII